MRDFADAKRIVIKVGTSTLTTGSGIDRAYIEQLARQVAELCRQGRQPVIVSSGAIGMGMSKLSLAERPSEIPMRQACAAVGQPILMAEYSRCFEQFGILTAQVLLTAEVFNNRKSYLNLRNAIETLLRIPAVPILNENDSVSTDEIGTTFGDNDRLSALVASKIDADLLIILTDIDALYDKDPRRHPDARPIETVHQIDQQLIAAAGGSGSKLGTGGMRTKLEAARIASDAGCKMVLAHGRTDNVVQRIVAGETIGTLILPKRRLTNRQRWILNSVPAGTIYIDNGAVRAIQNNKSLLPSGVISVDGLFEAGQVVWLNQKAKAVTSLSSAEIQALAGKHSSEVRRLLGENRRDVVALPEDIVFMDR